MCDPPPQRRRRSLAHPTHRLPPLALDYHRRDFPRSRLRGRSNHLLHLLLFVVTVLAHPPRHHLRARLIAPIRQRPHPRSREYSARVRRTEVPVVLFQRTSPLIPTLLLGDSPLVRMVGSRAPHQPPSSTRTPLNSPLYSRRARVSTV